MKEQWMAMEHYRLHRVEEWPDGPHKNAAMAAIQSTLASLSGSTRDGSARECCICRSRTEPKLAPVLLIAA